MLAPQTLLLSIVTRLLDEPTSARLLALGKAVAVLAMQDGSLVALFAPAFGEPEAIGAELRSIVEHHPRTPLKLVLVGGSAELRGQLPRAGLLSRRVVQLFHLAPGADGDWSLWTGGGARPQSPMGEVLQAAGRAELPTPDLQALVERVEARPSLSPEHRAQLEQERAFSLGLRGPSWVTWGVAGVLLAVFLCEELWGGSETVPTLARMGGNTEATLVEPWRLLSSALLHAGWLHVAVNGYVLLLLGGFVERLFGRARYGVLLGAAAVGGSLASVLLSPAPLSVGASGAIWGVLGAAAALTWRPGTLIPASMVAPLRRNAMINVLINLAVSFHPRVDLWAHLGGGLVGAALVLGGVLTRGLQRSGAPESHETGRAGESRAGESREGESREGEGREGEGREGEGREGEGREGEAGRRGFTIAAGVLAGLALGSLALAWSTDRPWELRHEPTAWERHALGSIELEAPATLGDPVPLADPSVESAAESGQGWLLGNPIRDPLSLDITVTPYQLDAQTLANEVAALRSHQPQTPADAEVAVPWRLREGEGWPSFEVEYDYPNGLRHALWVQLRGDAEIRIESVRWPALGGAWAGALQRIYISLERDPLERSEPAATGPAPPPSPGR